MSIFDSFWHRLGAASKGAAMATPLGSIWALAQHTDTPQDAGFIDRFQNSVSHSMLGPVFGPANGALKGATASTDPNATPDQREGFGVFDALHLPYDYLINRPLGTAAMVTQRVVTNQGDLFDKSLWRQSWNDSDHVSAGQAGYSNNAAQAGVLASFLGINVNRQQTKGVGQLYNPDFNPASEEAQTFFKHTWMGRIGSGAMDLGANVLDPTFVAGKGIKAARVGSTTLDSPLTRDAVLQFSAHRAVDPEEANAALSAAYPARQAKKIVKHADTMDKFLMSTRGMTMPALMTVPQLKETGDAGALAYFFSRADQTPDDAAALANKRDIFAVALGNPQAMKRLQQNRADLLQEMNRMAAPVETTSANALFRWDDGGQGMLDVLNARSDEVMQGIDKIDTELTRLSRLDSISHSTSKIGTDLYDEMRFSNARRDVQESLLYDGMASRPVRIVRGTVGKAVQGFVNTVSADEGFDELRRTLAKANIPAQVRAKYLDDFARAASRGERGRVVREADRALFFYTAKAHGRKPAEAYKLYELASKRRQAVFNSLRTRLYSAAPELKYIKHTDEDGVEHAFDRPFLKSQLDDMVPLTNPQLIDQVLRDEARTGWLGEVTTNGRQAGQWANDLAMHATRAWKDTTLMRGAYPLRIQVDTQMRLMAALGGLHYISTAFDGVKNMAKNGDMFALERRLAGKSSKALVKGTGKRSSILNKSVEYKGIETAPALDGGEGLAGLTRTLEGHTTRDLAQQESTDASLRWMRATGNWGKTEGDDPKWADDYLRHVNQQLRNSPVARMTLVYGDDDAIVGAIQSNPELRAEWQDFKGEFHGDPYAWVNHVRMDTNHTMPLVDLRMTAAERPLKLDDLKGPFDDVTLRPSVPGESYVPYMKSPVAAQWERFRQGYYKWASDMPETVMGRHPLYNNRFRTHMREVIDRYGGEELTSEDIAKARRVADRRARMDVGNTLFELSHTTNLAHHARFLSPFFAAWEDTMLKWGRLLYDDPSRAVRLSQFWTAPEKMNITYTDDQGVERVLLPKILAPAGSVGWSVRKDSGNIVFQGSPWWLPGFGPMVSVPTNEIVKRAFPNEAKDPILKYVLPFGVDEKGPVDQLLPGWAKRARAAFGWDKDAYNQTYSMLAEQETVKYNMGKRSTRPSVSEIARKTRNWHLMRALTAFGAPVSADPTPEFQFYIDEAHRYRDDDANIRAAHQAWEASPNKSTTDEPPANWEAKFYRDYPDYFELTASLSQNNTGIVASDKAYVASKKFKKEIAANPQYGWFFVGPDNVGDFSQGVYANQKSQALGYGNSATSRGTRDDPMSAVTDAEASKGWMIYRKGMTALQLELEARGLHSFSQSGAEDLAASKAKFVNELSNENPQWASDFGQRDASKAQDFLRVAKDNMNGDLAKRPDMQALDDYLKGRRYIQGLLAARGSKALPPADNPSSANADLRQMWDQFTGALIAENMGFEQMWQRALEADDLSGEL